MYIIQIPCRSVSGNVILVRTRVSAPLSGQHLICPTTLSYSAPRDIRPPGKSVVVIASESAS